MGPVPVRGAQTGAMGWPEFYEQALHGIVDLAMGREAALHPNSVRRRASADGWERVHAGAWRLPTHPSTSRSGVAAALRLVGPDAHADRHTALGLRGLVPFPTRHQVLLPHGCRVRSGPGVDVRRTRHLRDEDRDVVDGLPSVTVARALLDLARDLRTGALRTLALAAQQQDTLDLDDLRDVLARHPQALGRRRLRQVLHDLGRDGSESGLEFTTRDRVVAAGLRPDAEQPTILVGGTRRRIDIAWLALRVGIECQGYRDHAGREGLDRDAVRLNSLVAEGDWVILQVTVTMVYDGWEQFLADLRACLRRRADQLGLPHPEGVAAA